MLDALNKSLVKKIYDKSYKYYDLYHKLGTFSFDNRGRKFLVKNTVKAGDYILDAGGGTGTTGLMALKRSGEKGRLVILDISGNMLRIAISKSASLKVSDRVSTTTADMYDIPYDKNTFDVVLSTYSTCPLENPIEAVKEMLRVLKPNGLLGIAHSAEPIGKLNRLISNWIESIIWKFPRLSLGCRKFDISEDLKKMKIDILEDKIIGTVPWYFRLYILRKKLESSSVS